MKRFLKIFGITLGSILGILAVALCVALYIVFTPKRLTPIVRNIADKYISCQHYIGDVELTFFSTFPDFGLHIDGLYLLNAMEGVQSDTLLAAPEAVAVINPIKFLHSEELDIRKVLLKNVTANVFCNENGESNTDVFILPKDTTQETDTTGFSLPFKELNIDKIEAKIAKLTYLSEADSVDIRLQNTALEVGARSFDDIDMSLSTESVDATIGKETYANGLQCVVRMNHTAFSTDSMALKLRDALISINEFEVHIAGDISVKDDIAMALDIRTNDWQIPALLQLLPASMQSMINGIDIESGKMQLQAHAEGIYNDSTMPIVTAKLLLTDAAGAYKAVLPYSIKDIELDADAYIDLNDSTASGISINQLKAHTQKTSIAAKGSINELMGDMLCDLQTDIVLHIPDILPLLPQETQQQLSAEGTLEGNMYAKIRLSDLSEMRLQKGYIGGEISCKTLKATYDSMFVDATDMRLDFSIPNKNPQHKTTNRLKANLQAKGLQCNMPALQAITGKTKVSIESSDIWSNNRMLYAYCEVGSEKIEVAADSMGGSIAQPMLKLYTEYDTKDTTRIPLLNADMTFAKLQGNYDNTDVEMLQSDIRASISGNKRDKSQPRLQLQLATNALKASMDEDIRVQTKQISISATARRNPTYDEILLQWNPKLAVKLTDGIVNMASFKETIEIPSIDFDYSNKVCHITDSHIKIGKSDFALSGEIDNIGKWLKNESILTGELNFVSDHTDVNELMVLTSSDSGSEESEVIAETPTTETEKQPYLVPKTVNLTLHTMIKEAVVFDQTATNLGGRLYIKDGVLVLEEMGFICNAARLQLTAMYKTPRRNHLYLGLDYHMLDINVAELVNMIPQIDSMIPMLRSFKGNAEFHLALETYLNSQYELKTSTTRGACSISGKDLVLLDSETFGQIAKILMFNKKTENKVDSISAEITLYKNEIDIYPFCLSIDNYMAAVGGRHNLDMTFDYHVSLLKPLYIGVDVSGNFDDLKIRLAKCRYAQDFRPIFRKETDTLNMELRKKIKESLQKNVKQ
ncbi:MAG: hypothetical protein NC038_02410 [Paludibacter sp.]|nr:hypothetical protein [Bacteroidales bacterium]MCM1068528.1 hypothetical protein [Prevotella sp.]MCM1353482.1 hypothetical protein [Bacteroides sp.]MCM1442643.1 hypothetical protein [Muribaculum sp.]MCM1481488.1 hypothetical protein [Paludibacter sp.]